MRIILFLLFQLFLLSARAQETKDFDPVLGRDMIALCNSFSFEELFGHDDDIIPKGYEKFYESESTKLDNMFQAYIKDSIGVLCFRGSTANRYSWIENFHSAMIPAIGEVKVNEDTFQYYLSDKEDAAIHSGYMLGLMMVHRDVLGQINELNKRGVFQIYLTGHSQGGALVLLLMAYLDHVKGDLIAENNSFKTFAFANPMIGNDIFVNDHNERFAKNNTVYSIINPKDLVPQLPLEYLEGNPFSKKNINHIIKEGVLDKELLLKSVVLQSLGGATSSTIKYVTKRATKQLSKKVGKLTLPEFTADVNYAVSENRILLAPFDYPKILRDSSILESDSLEVHYPQDENGDFIDIELYQKSPTFYQHKPYNYYVGFLKMYFKEEYEKLEMTYLIESL